MAEADADPAVVPLSPERAKALFREILEKGVVEFTRHAAREMARDDMATTDAINLLRAGVVKPPEYENGEWRYRVETRRMTIVVSFGSRTELTVVTGWRNER